MSARTREQWLSVCVRKAVRVVSARANMDLRGIAHQVVIVDALGALACSNIRQDFGQPAVRPGVDERGAAGVVFAPANRDGLGRTAFMVIKRATGNTAIGNMGCHMRSLRTSAVREGQRPRPHGRPAGPNQKDPTV